MFEATLGRVYTERRLKAKGQFHWVLGLEGWAGQESGKGILDKRVSLSSGLEV